ncbi:UNVERIFIED_CONTAM: hypothetical protein GTU68_036368 [Idotea baltica]|jgi:hypothetical protein
MCRL